MAVFDRQQLIVRLCHQMFCDRDSSDWAVKTNILFDLNVLGAMWIPLSWWELYWLCTDFISPLTSGLNFNSRFSILGNRAGMYLIRFQTVASPKHRTLCRQVATLTAPNGFAANLKEWTRVYTRTSMASQEWSSLVDVSPLRVWIWQLWAYWTA